MQIIFDGATVRHDAREAIHPLTLSLDDHRIGVIGLNGSGKTTFARLIAGLTVPSDGKVMIDGLDSVADANTLRGRIGFIFQTPGNQIILPIVEDDIALGLKPLKLGKAEIAARVEAALSRLGIAHLAKRRPHELSGGELQLAALAAVLVTAPSLVIFDEPTNQLDLKNRAVVEQAIAALDESAIVISHDLDLVATFPRVLVFDQGRIAFDGPAQQAIARYREIALR
ncbi:energy-coupling factor ABC transporter ATP-binding protein [Rhizobium halophytocola]|uniref:Biotin transport system ATP-binding protein n=1 Tax=Rhizobium halophytocola TaxID=735519 RepID=A0ABS4DXB2_9HYPH|nr:ABC transporter ATP-binding protein [Rhizobium halophytocola]MBP1850337.1 biotin transport system ATP-binding protein [Rhizobium halophytocola]